jgi:hypothetical protein
MSRLRYVVVTVILVCSALSFGAAQDSQLPVPQPALPVQYAATAFGQAGSAAGRNFSLNVYVQGLSSNTEIDGLVGALKQKGPSGLVSAMDGMKEKGRVTPTGSIGTAMRVVRIRPTKNGGQNIVLVTNRPIALAEMANSTRSSDYPFAIVVLDVDKDGKGTGSFAPLCTIRFNKNDDVEIEHYGQKPFRLANVFRQK